MDQEQTCWEQSWLRVLLIFWTAATYTLVVVAVLAAGVMQDTLSSWSALGLGLMTLPGAWLAAAWSIVVLHARGWL